MNYPHSIPLWHTNGELFAGIPPPQIGLMVQRDCLSAGSLKWGRSGVI
jgi:hypothetical protein